MSWWWKSAYEARLEERLTYLEERILLAEQQADYWREKAERLLDAALFKRREINAPVFEDTKPAEESILQRVVGAMGTMETDTSKRPPASSAMPITPMK